MVSALASINVVTTWMGDCLRLGKLSGYVTSDLGGLSILPSVGLLAMVDVGF